MLEEQSTKMEFMSDSSSSHEDSYDDISDSSGEEPSEFMKCPWKRLAQRSSFSSTNSLPLIDQEHYTANYLLSRLGKYKMASDSEAMFEKSYEHEEMDGSVLAPYTPRQSSSDMIDGDITDIDESRVTEEVFGSRAEETNQEEPKYYHVANELLTSERTYVQDLSVIEKKVHSVVLLARTGGKPILPEKTYKQIFLNIRDIYTFNKNLLDELEDRMDEWDPNCTTISDILSKRVDCFLKLYSMYYTQYEDAQIIYFNAMRDHKPFEKLVKVVENSHFSRQLPLHYFMITPIQRLPKYILLLKDYYKKLPNCHPDKEASRVTMEQITEVTQLLNDRMVNKEDHDEIMKIQDWFTHETLVEPGRKFYLKGPVYSVATTDLSRSSLKRKPRIAFLFSDILLVAKVSFNNKLKTKCKIPLVGIKLESIDHSVATGFSISYDKGCLKLLCRDIEERDKWVKYIGIVTQEMEKFSTCTTTSYNQDDSKVKFDGLCPLPDEEERHTHHGLIKGLCNRDILKRVEKERARLGGLGGTLSSYALYDQPESDDKPCRRWLVLTYNALIGYISHKTADTPIWALPLSGCALLPTNTIDKKHRYTISLSSPVGEHCINLGNEYDFNLWSKKFHELLYSSSS